jgi:hypothetical protein
MEIIFWISLRCNLQNKAKKKQSKRLTVRINYSQTRANNFAIASLSIFDQV